MYRYASQARMNVTNTKLRRRIVLILLVVMLAVTITMSVVGSSAIVFRNNTKAQFTQRMASGISSALEVGNRLESSTSSSTSQKLGVIRQYIYLMEQINAMSVSLYGEQGRFAPGEAFSALYTDLDNYESLIQSAKTSTLEERTLLLNHLTILQGYISGKITS